MQEEKIKNIFALENITPEINERIKDIEESGYVFDSVTKETIKTTNSTTGSYGYFNAEDFYKMKGIEYTIATFKNANQQKRYCIIDNENNIIKKPYSRLKYESETGLSDTELEFINKLQKALKSFDIDLKEHEVYELFGVHNADISTSPEKSAKKVVKDLTLDINRAIINLQKYQVNNNTERIWTSNKNGKILRDELYCGMDRSSDALRYISPILRIGENSSEQEYIVSLTTEKIMPKIAEFLMNNKVALNAEQARTFGVEEKAFKETIALIKKDPENSKKILENYLKYTQTSFKNNARIAKVHPSVINVLDKLIKENPENLNPIRINSDLQKISQRLNSSLKNFTDLNDVKRNKVIEKFLSDFVTENKEYALYDVLKKASIKTNPVTTKNIEDFYNFVNKYLDEGDKLKDEKIIDFVTSQINNLSTRLNEVLKNDTLNNVDKLSKAKGILDDFDKKIDIDNHDYKKRRLKINEIFGTENPPINPGIFYKENFVKDYVADIGNKKYEFIVPELKTFIDLQKETYKETESQIESELYEESPYIYMFKDEQPVNIKLPNGISVYLNETDQCKKHFEDIIQDERSEIKIPQKEETCIRERVEGFYPMKKYTVQIGDRMLTFGDDLWTNGGRYTAFEENKKGFGVSSVDSEYARDARCASSESINEIINLATKYPKQFWQLFDKVAEKEGPCGVYSLYSNFADRLREYVTKNWDTIECSLETKLLNNKSLSTNSTEIDAQEMIK